MQLRRCANLVIEPREDLKFDLDSLLQGGNGLSSELGLFALAPHLQQELPVSGAEMELLAAIPSALWTEASEISKLPNAELLQGLIDKGLLITDDITGTDLRQRDDLLRQGNWQSLSAANHYFGRWQGVRSGEASRQAGYATLNDLVAKLGPPPLPVKEQTTPDKRIALPHAEMNDFDQLLHRRVTCRNFDTNTFLGLDAFATMLHRVFGAQVVMPINSENNAVLKRNSPSGGGLHPTEAYLIVQRVEGVEPGLYHYHPIDHALEPIRELAADVVADLALRSVAAQDYFANAHVLLVMVSRFPRSFWKYRNHAKAYRVAMLDVGHLSQTLYLSATDLGLGAFITGAINEIEIEQALGLDPLVESALAISGFGQRSAERSTIEFDPGNKIWDAEGKLHSA